MNDFNIFWPGTYILQIIIQQVDRLFVNDLYFEDINFPVKIKDIHEIEKKISINFSFFFLYENTVKCSINVSKKSFEEKDADLLLIAKKVRGILFLSKIVIHLCMIIQYMVGEKVFVIIVYKLLV